MECLSPIGEYHLRNTSHDFELVCFLARRGNVHVLFLQRLSKCARTNYTNSWLTSISESLRVHLGCYLSLGYSRSRSVCPNHTVRHIVRRDEETPSHFNRHGIAGQRLRERSDASVRPTALLPQQGIWSRFFPSSRLARLFGVG